MPNDRLSENKTSEQEQRVFTFRVTQLTQLIWLVFSILEVLIALRVGLKIAWAIQSVRRVRFHRPHEPVVGVTQTIACDRPSEVNPGEDTKGIASPNHENQVARPKSFFAGLLLGSLAAVGATLLLAPQAGEKTRIKIQQKTLELGEQVSETVEDAVAQARVNTHKATADVHAKAEELRQRGHALLDKGKEGMSAVVQAGKTAIQGS
jgi:gas vesicle protein